MDVYARLKSLGLSLPEPPPVLPTLEGIKKLDENLLYVSGCGPMIGDKGFKGKVGKDITLEEGRNAARNVMLNFLSLLEQYIGDLNKVESFVKLIVFVASSPDFDEQATVANAATEMLIDIFGVEIGRPARSAIGVAVLPTNISVEIEGIVRIKK